MNTNESTGPDCKPLRTKLPYRPDSSGYFAAVAESPWSAYLDSAATAQGRYDIITADPVATIVTRGGITEVTGRHGTEGTPADPFEVLRERLRPTGSAGGALPFAGGLVGWFGYDLVRRLERLPSLAADREHLPELAVGIYDWALVVDHARRRAELVSGCRDRSTRDKWPDLLRRFGAAVPLAMADFRLDGRLESNLDRPAYGRAFHRIQRYIRDGDCYQVNLARRFEAPARGDPWSLYRRLRAANPAPYGAFLRTPFGSVLSSSPERFVAVRDGAVETRPIKGTRRRDQDPVEDRRQAAALAASEKDRAENLMIVDLLRNDLGRNCIPGSIHVPELCKLESFPTVHHLVSTIRGRLAPGRDALDLLRGCFPGGSITGAPKLRAMEIIEELEPQRRGVYCGAIGYVGYDGAMDTNIAIRTLVFSDNRVRLWAGGGIVADSEAEAEFQETLDKAAALFGVLQDRSAP